MLFMHTTYRPSIFRVLLQFKDLISENIKIKFPAICVNIKKSIENKKIPKTCLS